MQATVEHGEFWSALIRECEADLELRVTVLQEISRIFRHAFLCPNCRQHCPHIAAVLADVAKQVGFMIRGWEVIKVELEVVLLSYPNELALLVRLCREGVHVEGDGSSEVEWRTALGLCALAVAIANERTTAVSEQPRCFASG